MTKISLFSPRWARSVHASVSAVCVWLMGACGGNTSSTLGSTNNPAPTSTEPAASSTPVVPTATNTATPPDGEYWMNFFPGKKGPVEVGGRYSVWIGFDLGQASKDYYPPDTFLHEGQIAINVKTHQELSSACGTPLKDVGLLVAEDMGPWKSTWIDHVSVIMISPYQTTPGPDPEPPNSCFMCYAYRVGEEWTWQLQRLSSTWNSDEARYTIDFPVKKQGVDAFHIMFESNVLRTLERVKIATKPGP